MKPTLIMLTVVVALTLSVSSSVAQVCVSGNGAGKLDECRRVGGGDVCVTHDGFTGKYCVGEIREIQVA